MRTANIELEDTVLAGRPQKWTSKNVSSRFLYHMRQQREDTVLLLV